MITLDFPSYLPLLTHCTNRALREELYRAFISRASSGDIPNPNKLTKSPTPYQHRTSVTILPPLCCWYAYSPAYATSTGRTHPCMSGVPAAARMSEP